GLKYRVNARDKGVVEVAVTQGRADLVDEGGRTEHLKTRQALDVRGRHFSSSIVELPDAPSPAAPADGTRRTYEPGLEIELGWVQREDAARYRVQIARDTAFEDVLREMSTGDHVLRFSPPGPGIYSWRVAARDKNGRASDFGPSRPSAIGEGTARLLSPPADAVISFWKARPSIVFSWSEPEERASYVLIVARDGPLKRVVMIERSEASSLETQRLDA